MINEFSIRCFLGLCETLSFTETARQLYISQQAVSKHIAKLEEELGFRLFFRNHHAVSITKAGETFYGFFRRYQTEFQETLDAVRESYADARNALHIGYLEWLDISAGIGQAVREMRTMNPELVFEGERHPQHELNELLLNHRLDLIITYKEFAPQDVRIRTTKVLETPLVLLVSPEHPKAVDGATVEDFRCEPFIKAAASHETRTECRNRARKQCQELGFAPSSLIISPNLESAYMAVELGQGVMVSTMLSRMSLGNHLKCYPVGKREELRCFWYQQQENPSVEKFAELLGLAQSQN